jgi:predicted lipoprotein
MKVNLFTIQFAKVSVAAASLLALALVPAACSSDSPTPNKFDSFDRKGMLQSLGNNVILPAFTEFASKADSLVSQATAFNQQPTATSLAATQALWLRTANAYKRCEVYQFGPLTNALAAAVDFWPTRPANTDSLLVRSPVITEALVAQQGVTVKGLAGLEYALYHGSPATALARYTTATDAAKRRDYLLATAQDLRTSARQVRDAWQNGYVSTFAQQDGQSINGSINVTANAVISHIDYIKNSKVGIPAGKKDGTVQPEKVEAYESGTSIPQLLNDLTGVERLFTGTGATGSTGPGFNALLDHLGATYNGQPLSNQILSQLADCRAKANALGNTTLAQAVTQNPTGVTALYDSLKQLLVLTKVDMVSAVGVTLTFSDNDGD